MEAEVVVDVDGVLDVVAIEGDGIVADGRGEGILEEADLVVVDVDIGEDVVHGGGEDVARLDELVDACVADALDDGLLVVGLTAVDLL